MKTIISFIPQINDCLVKAYGQDVTDRIVLACQSAMNDKSNRTEKEGEAKRGAVKGGIRFNAAGEMTVKDMTARETSSTEYTWKQTAPIELVKFNDRLAALYRDTGVPSGPLTLDTFPRYHRAWMDKVATNAAAKPAPEKPAKPAKNGGKAASNGHRETAPVGA